MPENAGPYINTFVRRGRRWHLVESKIADRYVTRCGRQMKEELDGRGTLVTVDEAPDDYCRQCDRGERNP